MNFKCPYCGKDSYSAGSAKKGKFKDLNRKLLIIPTKILYNSNFKFPTDSYIVKDSKMFRRKIYTIYEMTEDGRLVEPKRFEYGRYVVIFGSYYDEEDAWQALEEYAKHSYASFIVLTTYEVS